MSPGTAELAWNVVRLVAVPALLLWALYALVAKKHWREPVRLGLLLLAPALITLWFMHDGGLSNGLNRWAYYLFTGLFFALYTAVMAGTWLVQRSRGLPSAGHGRATSLGALALLAWVCITLAYENLA